MNVLGAPQLSPLSQALCILCILLLPLALAGVALINTGLGRSRSSAHVMMSSLCVMAVAGIVYCICGFHWEEFPGQPAHIFTFATNPWDWLGAGRFFLGGISWNGSAVSLAACLQLFSIGLAAIIPLGAGADRWKLGACCVSTALLAGWTYPLFAHWIWGGGWLAALGANFELGRGFLDAGGSSTIQVVGGLSGLSVAWLLGPRRGKYSSNGMPAAIPGHNAIYILFGCLLAFAGWLGLNSAGAMLFAGVPPEKIALITVNTLLSAASAGLVTALITQMRFGKPDASLTANGWVGGLVASSAACPFLHPAEAIIIGIIAGVLVTMSVQWLEFNLKIDDPTGSISVHALAGIWGILAAGLFARFQTPVKGQFIAQLVGLAVLLGFIFPMTYGLNALVNRFYPYRVSMDGERQGMDLHELGADAYPEFVTHSDEYSQR